MPVAKVSPVLTHLSTPPEQEPALTTNVQHVAAVQSQAYGSTWGGGLCPVSAIDPSLLMGPGLHSCLLLGLLPPSRCAHVATNDQDDPLTHEPLPAAFAKARKQHALAQAELEQQAEGMHVSFADKSTLTFATCRYAKRSGG